MSTSPIGSGDSLARTKRSTVRRKRDRGHFERSAVNAILDEGLLCHVGFADEGETFVVPMAYARVGDVLYLHGAVANRTLRSLAAGVDACVTVTLLDGLVMARAALNHSMNYRSVMLFGTATRVMDKAEQLGASDAILDHVAPGRSRDARPPSEAELRSTSILRFPVSVGSAKVRTGGPLDDPDDLGLEVWAGEVPLELVAGPARPDPGLRGDPPLPSYLDPYPSRRRPPADPVSPVPS